jgi:hypothetical protein
MRAASSPFETALILIYLFATKMIYTPSGLKILAKKARGLLLHKSEKC